MQNDRWNNKQTRTIRSLLSAVHPLLKQLEGLKGANVSAAPANEIIEYEYRSMVSNDTRFTGHPGPEWEENMHKLMEGESPPPPFSSQCIKCTAVPKHEIGTLLRVSEDELKLFGSDSIPLKDGGYAAGLGVAHNLHCVVRITHRLP